MNRFAQCLACGSLSSAVSRTLTSPLDVVKTILQCQRGPEPKYAGVIDTFRAIIREQGITGLWRGNLLALIRIVPYSAVKFAAFERYKSLFHCGNDEPDKLKRLLASTLAGLNAVAATYPLDVLRTRFTVQSPLDPKYTGVIQAVARIIREEGVRALYSGFSTTIIGAMPYDCSQFVVHECIEHMWGKYMKRPMNNAERLLSGCIAGSVAQTISYPIDTIRKTMQVAPAGTYKNMLDCAGKIVKEEGARGLFKGVSVNIAKVVPFSALSYYCYGQSRELLEKVAALRMSKAK